MCIYKVVVFFFFCVGAEACSEAALCQLDRLDWIVVKDCVGVAKYGLSGAESCWTFEYPVFQGLVILEAFWASWVCCWVHQVTIRCQLHAVPRSQSR